MLVVYNGVGGSGMTITDTGIGQSALRELSLSLRQLVGEDSILHFAQQVGIPDITLRKYLDGVQPTADNRHPSSRHRSESELDTDRSGLTISEEVECGSAGFGGDSSP